MPASTAVLTASRIASASGTDTASPSTPSLTAASMSCACSSGSLFDPDHLTVTPMSLPAASAPFLATAQNAAAVVVRDQGDRQILALGEIDGVVRAAALVVTTAAAREHEHTGRQHQEQQRKSPHDSATLSLRVGASECR